MESSADEQPAKRLLVFAEGNPGPFRAFVVREKCQLPHSVEMIESNCRSLVRAGRLRGLTEQSFEHPRSEQLRRAQRLQRLQRQRAKTQAAKRPAKKQKSPEEGAMPAKINNTPAAVPAPAGKAARPALSAQLQADVDKVAEALQQYPQLVPQHVVVDPAEKIAVLNRLIDLLPPALGDVLEQIRRYDIEPFIIGGTD